MAAEREKERTANGRPYEGTVRIVIERLEPRHARITPYLRKADVDEMNDGLGIRTAWGVAYSIACSRPGFAVVADGIPAALFGIGPSLEKGLGVPWLLATPEIERWPVTFYRMSKRLFPRLASGYDRLVNWVDARNVLSLRWLAWLGFEAGPPAPWGVLGLEFHKMTWERG
jgi:hypothetical protein